MDQKLKNEILASAKTNRVHKIPIVESPFEPEERNVIWLKDGVMYYFNNGEWESLYSTSGGDTPEPEPELDPKYVRTPIEFTEFELKTVFLEGDPFSAAISNMVSVQEEAIEYQEGTTITTKTPGYDDITSSDAPIYATAETTGDEAETYAITQIFLSEAYPNDTIEVVSVTYYPIENTALVIAKVNGENKTFAFVTNVQSVPEGVTITANSPTEVVSGSELINPIPRAQFPITLRPMVLGKYEEEGNTYAFICWYADNLSGEVFYKLPGDYGTDYYIPQINNKRWKGVVNTNQYLIDLITAFQAYDCTSLSDKLPTRNPLCILEAFGNSDYYALHMKSGDYPGKSLVLVTEGQTYDSLYIIEGQTNLTDEQILMDYLDLVDPSDIDSQTVTIDLYYFDGMG